MWTGGLAARGREDGTALCPPLSPSILTARSPFPRGFDSGGCEPNRGNRCPPCLMVVTPYSSCGATTRRPSRSESPLGLSQLPASLCGCHE